MKIDKINTTNDTITSRGGIAFFARYITEIGIISLFSEYFSDLRKSKKGLPVTDIFKQILCFFMDGTCRHLTYFDDLAQNKGYADSIEQDFNQMASSHTVKRFCKSFNIFKAFLFRKILKKLFIWRLKIDCPQSIVIDMDPSILDNDDASKRHGVGPAYNNKKGFGPLFFTWDRFVIDAVFRGGIRHSNYSDTAVKAVTQIVELIRSAYAKDVVIILTCDAGFFDQKNFQAFEELGIFYIAGARMTQDVKKVVSSLPESAFNCLKKNDQVWRHTGFGFLYGTWKKFRRLIFCQPLYENDQLLLPFNRKDSLIVTNIRPDTVTPDMPKEVRQLTDDAQIIRMYHKRGASELVFRAFKDFGTEKMPFKLFTPNTAFFYMMLTAFFLFEAFKQDALHPIIPVTTYAQTLRRKFIDTAAKITNHSKTITLKFGIAAFRSLKLDKIWEACNTPPPIPA